MPVSYVGDKLELRKLTGEIRKLAPVENHKANGLNPQSLCYDEKGDLYFLKTPKTRTDKEIFSNHAPHLSSEAKQQHKVELQLQQSLHEMLESCLAKAIFGDMLIVPELDLYLTADKKPLIASKAVAGFQEFLRESKKVANKTKPEEWKGLQFQRSELNLAIEHAHVLGSLFYIALLMGHWDVVNNINLSNSGFVAIKTVAGIRYLPVIVDWGNCGGVGFGGLSADETAFQNPYFPSRAKYFGNKADNKITGFQYCIPFDTQVCVGLPRQIVSDLFDMNLNNKSEEEKKFCVAMLAGFECARTQAQKSMQGSLNQLIQSCVKETLHHHTDDPQFLSKLINEQFYLTDKKNDKSFTLAAVLKGRFESLLEIEQLIKKGFKLDHIAEMNMQKILHAQRSTSAFQASKAGYFVKKNKMTKSASNVRTEKKLIRSSL